LVKIDLQITSGKDYVLKDTAAIGYYVEIKQTLVEKKIGKSQKL
jgi:spore coat polysaccharide biosynthesis protein SpsF (cytidylyltransferase family)